MGAAGSVAAPFESAEAAVAAGKTELEVKAWTAASAYIDAFNAHDEVAVGALCATSEDASEASKPPVWLGNNMTGVPRPMKTEMILGLLKGFMFETFGFKITDPKISSDGALVATGGVMGVVVVVDLTLSIDTALPAWEKPSGRPPPFPQVSVKEHFGGAESLPAQLTLGVNEGGQVVSIYWHMGEGATAGRSAVDLHWQKSYARLRAATFPDGAAAEAGAAAAKTAAAARLASEGAASRAMVLGLQTPTSAGYPPKVADGAVCRWMDLWVGDEPGPEAALDGATVATELEGDCWHLEKHGAGSRDGIYTVLVAMKCKDAESAEKLAAVHRATGTYQLGNESAALSYTVFAPAGPDKTIVRNIAQFATAKAHDKHKALSGPTRDFFTKPIMALMVLDPTFTDGGILEFASTSHLEKDDL